MVETFRNWLIRMGLSESRSDLALELLALAGVVLLALLANWVAKKIILRVVHGVVRRTKTTWDDVLVERKVFDAALPHRAGAGDLDPGADLHLRVTTRWPI